MATAPDRCHRRTLSTLEVQYKRITQSELYYVLVAVVYYMVIYWFTLQPDDRPFCVLYWLHLSCGYSVI